MPTPLCVHEPVSTDAGLSLWKQWGGVCAGSVRVTIAMGGCSYLLTAASAVNCGGAVLTRGYSMVNAATERQCQRLCGVPVIHVNCTKQALLSLCFLFSSMAATVT